MEELISVIVPVYNVEERLDECLKSICCQTYTNIEIILIDDGSTDNSKKICLQWCTKDSRVIFESQENKGAAAARNKGLLLAKGSYIMFVDSDDYISNNICERLFYEINKYDADISICRMEKIEINKTYPTKPWSYKEDEVVLSKVEALKEFFLDKIDCGPCQKLYKKNILENICFPEGRINEDFVFVYKAIYNSNNVILFNDILYHYWFRENSVTSSGFNKKHFDKYYNCLEMISFVEENISEVKKEATFYLLRQTFYLLKHIVLNNLISVYPVETRELKDTITKHLLYILSCPFISYREKISYILIGYSTYFYNFIHKF